MRDVAGWPGALVDIQPATSAALARPTSPQPPCEFGPGGRVMPLARIYAGSVFGADLFVGDGASISEGCRFGDRCVVGRNATVGARVRLGNGVRIMDLSHIVGGTEIGDDCFIGIGVVTSNDARPLPYVWDEARIQPPQIGRGVMIGSGAVLCPGVTIGDGAWIAAGAVVVRDVPPGSKVRGTAAYFAGGVVTRIAAGDWPAILSR
jgi:acetyltransferase-like isoleucine patch superfamily enzyme